MCRHDIHALPLSSRRISETMAGEENNGPNYEEWSEETQPCLTHAHVVVDPALPLVVV